jgi:hypothetical protein
MMLFLGSSVGYSLCYSGYPCHGLFLVCMLIITNLDDADDAV